MNRCTSAALNPLKLESQMDKYVKENIGKILLLHPTSLLF